MNPQTYALLFYAVGVTAFAWVWIRNIRREAEIKKRLEIAEFKAKCAENCVPLEEANRQLERANERIHEISDSALRGCPVVKFSHPSPVPPAADHWYYRVRIEGVDHLFTEEAVRDARQRAQDLITSPADLPL